MKLLISNKGKDYPFICLESNDDVVIFRAINEQVKAKQSVDFWFGFKSQTFRKSVLNYAAHEAESNNGMALVLSMKMEHADKETSLVEYCTMSDDIIDDMHKTMFKFIDNGKMVRVNKRGGFCSIDSLSDYHTVKDMNEHEMFNFILCGDTKLKFEINSNTIVIENDSYIPDRLVSQFSELTSIEKNKIQVITSFKSKSLLFKDDDFVKFFNDGIVNHNLRNIVFETTGQDMRQVRGIKNIFEYLMNKHKDKTINLYIKCWRDKRDLFVTNLKNINITFLD